MLGWTHIMTLEELREEIDRLDAQIVDLLKRRARCAREVGAIKRADGAPIFVPERESALIRKLEDLNGGELPEQALLSIYRQVMSMSFLLEDGLRVAFLGPVGTWSHQAALARFGECVEFLPFPSFQAVFAAVERGEANYGVVPIENSTDGSVSQAMDLFCHSPLRICDQVLQSVQNCLLANIDRSAIRTIYSHPQVLGQCREWLRQNFPLAEQVPTASTTVAARIAREEAEAGAAALGGILAAKLNGLRVLEENIQDKATNTTRFAVIGSQRTQPSGRDRTTLCFCVPHVAGSLVTVLEHFKRHGINILCIDSRPTRDTAWEYLFYVDVEGHEAAEPLRGCLEELTAQCPMLKVLGSYPES